VSWQAGGAVAAPPVRVTLAYKSQSNAVKVNNIYLFREAFGQS